MEIDLDSMTIYEIVILEAEIASNIMSKRSELEVGEYHRLSISTKQMFTDMPDTFNIASRAAIALGGSIAFACDHIAYSDPKMFNDIKMKEQLTQIDLADYFDETTPNKTSMPLFGLDPNKVFGSKKRKQKWTTKQNY